MARPDTGGGKMGDLSRACVCVRVSMCVCVRAPG